MPASSDAALTPRLAAAQRRLVDRIASAQQRLSAIYRLEIALEARDFLIAPDAARDQLGSEAPRTGLLAVEEEGELWLGLYFDPADAADPAAVLEETSHWLAVVWHTLQSARISPLVLELQAEIDRYAVVRTAGGDALGHFRRVRWLPDLDPDQRDRYRTAHAAAFRYCRRLEKRYPRRADLPGLLNELRRFYRRVPEQKLAA